MIHADFHQQLKWVRLMTPVTRERMERLESASYTHARLGYVAHIEPKVVAPIEFMIRKGAEVFIAPCVPQIAHAESFHYLESLGAKVFGVTAKNWEELERAWKDIIDYKPDYLFDIGGGLITQAVHAELPVIAASEATSTGIHHVKEVTPTFPVFNWNNMPIKEYMHNRYDVGSGIWYAFRKLTGLDLCRLHIAVIGFGLVGQSVASIAKGSGARVHIYDADNLKMMVAASEGYITSDMVQLVRNADVIITATGRCDALTCNILAHAKDGLIIGNAGHDPREINLDDAELTETIIPDVDLYNYKSRNFYLLCQGRLLNLAAGGGSAINTFDLITALIVDVVDFMLTKGKDYTAGLHQAPLLPPQAPLLCQVGILRKLPPRARHTGPYPYIGYGLLLLCIHLENSGNSSYNNNY